MSSSTRHSTVRDSLRFFGNFVRSPKSVGAVLPSSRWLAGALVGDLSEFSQGDVVVEYGPGTGPMTSVIRQRLRPGIRYLGIELDPKFHSLLQRRFSELDFAHGSAGDVKAMLEERGLGRPRRIISGLPFASLPAAVQDSVIDGTDAVLADDGEFRTFQYVHAYGLPSAQRFRRMMKERFGSFTRSRAVLRNVPPAYVLTYGR